MFGKDFLSLFCEEEIYKCFRHFARSMLICIGIYNSQRVIDLDRGRRQHQFVIYSGFLPNQHFIFIGDATSPTPFSKVVMDSRAALSMMETFCKTVSRKS